MILFPAVDMLGGRAVRLLRGEKQNITDYGTPLECALRWERQGGKYLHIVDLDGAFTGCGINLPHLKEIVSSVKIPVQTGGGVRSLKDIEERLKTGVARVILGTKAVTDRNMLVEAVREFGQGVIVGADALNNVVKVSGWVEDTGMQVEDFCKIMVDCGIQTIVYTDISRDGALKGVNSASCGKLQNEFKLDIIASGGVSDLHDLSALKAEGVYGAIIGKALYEGKIDLSTAVSLS